jgi:hypothetical protein
MSRAGNCLTIELRPERRPSPGEVRRQDVSRRPCGRPWCVFAPSGCRPSGLGLKAPAGDAERENTVRFVRESTSNRLNHPSSWRGGGFTASDRTLSDGLCSERADAAVGVGDLLQGRSAHRRARYTHGGGATVLDLNSELPSARASSSG